MRKDHLLSPLSWQLLLNNHFDLCHESFHNLDFMLHHSTRHPTRHHLYFNLSWKHITTDTWFQKSWHQAVPFISTPFPSPTMSPPSLFWGSSKRGGPSCSWGQLNHFPSLSSGKSSTSSTFWYLRKKEDGDESWALNTFIQIQRFKMVTIAAIKPSLDPGEWFVALGLQGAYLYMVVNPAHRYFLQFVIGNSHYQYWILPFSHLTTWCLYKASWLSQPICGK